MGKRSVLYIDHIQGDKLANLLFINQGEIHEEVLLAEQATIYSNRTLELFNATNVTLPQDPSKGPETLRAEKLERVIPIPNDFRPQAMKGSPRDLLNTPQLYRLLQKKKDRTFEIELLRRLITPFGCLIFAFLAVPMAAKHSRFRSGSGFALSLGIIAVYFMLSKMGRDITAEGKISPILGIGLPPLLFLIFGIFLQVGKNRWWSQFLQKGRENILLAFQSPIHAMKRRLKLSVRKTTSKGRSAANTLLFPSKLDTYVIKSFLFIYVLVQSSVLFMFTLVEYTQISKYIHRNKASADSVLRYLLYKMPEMLDITLFICLLTSILILFTIMSKNQEITAVRASGGNLQRLCVPLILCGLFASGLSYYIENSFLPHSNRLAMGQRNKIKNKSENEALFTQDVWLKTETGDILNYQYYDRRNRRLVGVRYYQFDLGADQLLRKSSLPSLKFERQWEVEEPGKAWLFWLSEDKVLETQPESIMAGTPFPLNFDIEDLSQKRRRASEFSIIELKSYLRYLKSLGYSENLYETALYAKYAQPLMPVIMMLLAMPLGIQVGRRGTFHGIGTGLVAGLSFWGLFELFKKLGVTGLLHPMAAGWIVVVLFGFIALYRFIHFE